METGILKAPLKYVYTEINEGKFKTTKHYLIKESDGKSFLSDKINIALDRKFALSTPNYWLSIRSTKWLRLTGLFYNYKLDLYFGDKGTNNKKEDLIIVKLLDYQRTAIVYYFDGYYTNDLNKVIHFINQ
jgi:hypothetical protein